ncbi:MAG: peptidylprolyl isomerase [Pseudomonadota bacterium]
MKLTDALLIAAVVLGIVTALVGLVDAGNPALDDATAAQVNGIAITADELRSLLERRAQAGVPVDELLGTLDDMIDEELLIQRASELGILRRDSNVRVAIIQAMEKSILNEVRGRSVADDEIAAFYRDNTGLFSEPRTLELEEVVITDPSLVSSLTDALEEGVGAATLAAASEVVSATWLPPVPMSLEALSRRFSQEVMAWLETAGEGDVLTYEALGGVHVLRVLSVYSARVPPFDEVRLSVLNELEIQREDLAYDDYLAWLRQRAEVRRNERLAP